MKMSNNPAKYEVQIEQYLQSILDMSENLPTFGQWFIPVVHFQKLEYQWYKII